MHETAKPRPVSTANAPLLTRKEGAASLNIALRSLDHLIAAKEIRVLKIGKSIRITPAAIADFIAAREGRN
jgi:excisionase family DNA binding protein